MAWLTLDSKSGLGQPRNNTTNIQLVGCDRLVALDDDDDDASWGPAAAPDCTQGFRGSKRQTSVLVCSSKGGCSLDSFLNRT